MKEYPKELKQKIIFLITILFFTSISGTITYLFFRNLKIIILTIFICIYLFYKIINLISILKKDEYIEITGVCTSAYLIQTIFGKYQKVQITDSKYKEYTLITNIKDKFKVNEMYRFYLKKSTDLSKEITNQDYIAIGKIYNKM